MAISDIIQVNITANTVYPSTPGFGIPLVLTVLDFFPGRTAAYSSYQSVVTDVIAAGGTAASTPCIIAGKLFSVNPSPSVIKFGKRILPYTQTFTLTCLSAVAGVVYSFSVGGKPITYTVPSSGSPTTTTVATAIAALITSAAPSGLDTAVGAAAVITVTAVSAKLLDLINDPAHLVFKDTTADPGIATDLANILNEDGNWYGLILDNPGSLEGAAAATWVEANKKLTVLTTSDTVAGTSATTDLISVIKAAAFDRTSVMASMRQYLSYSNAVLMAVCLTTAPGSENWAFKTLPGVTVDKLTATQRGFIIGKNGNTYESYGNGGLNATYQGMVGSGDFLDTTRGIDWLSALIQASLLGLLMNNSKVPFTDAGGDMVRGTVSGCLASGISVGFLANNPAPIVIVPLVATVSPIDRAARNMPGVSFSATLAGAINRVTVTGTVNI